MMTHPPIEVSLENFLQHAHYVKRNARNTILRYRDTIGHFIRFTNIKYPNELAKAHVQNFFLHGNRDKQWTPRTYRTKYMSLVVFFDYLVEQEHISKNYVRDMKCPRLNRQLPRCISQEQAQYLLMMAQNYPYKNKLIGTRTYAIFATFIYAGLRKDELCNLKCSDVDIENRALFIKGKGDKERMVPISNTLAVALAIYMEERKKSDKKTPYFFVSYHLDCGYTDAGIRRMIIQFRELCNFNFTAHMLRHTFATLMHRGGCDIYTLSKIMGHSSITTTTQYTWLVTEDLRSELFKHPLER